MKEVPVHIVTLILVHVATRNRGNGELPVAGIEHTHSVSHRFGYALFHKQNPLNSKF